MDFEKLGSDISSSEDELLTGGDRIENHYSPIGGSPKREDKKDDDDRMSLSSLSSGEQKIEVQKPGEHPIPQYQPYQPYPG